MRIEGTHKINHGFYIRLKPSNDLTVNMKATMKWYGWFLFVWNYAFENYEVKWFQYPKLIWISLKAILHGMKSDAI